MQGSDVESRCGGPMDKIWVTDREVTGRGYREVIWGDSTGSQCGEMMWGSNVVSRCGELTCGADVGSRCREPMRGADMGSRWSKGIPEDDDIGDALVRTVGGKCHPQR